MSLSQAKKARISEPFPCPECGAVKMTLVVENCRLEDGLVVNRLKHYKCKTCSTRFFDDSAMHRIQAERAKKSIAHTS